MMQTKTKNAVHEQYYVNAPSTWVKRLGRFRAYHALQTLAVNKREWSYLTAGDSDNDAILLVHGGGGDADTLFPYIEHLSETFYVIAPNIHPKAYKIDDVLTALRAIIAQEDNNTVHLVGIAFGALVAQMFIRKFMSNVRDMVITHTTIPSDHIAEPITMQRDIMRWYPSPFLRWFSRRAYYNNIGLSSTPAPKEARTFWQCYFDEAYNTRISKRHLLSRATLTARYHRDNTFTAKDLNSWHGDLLIIESSDDDVIGEGDRGALKGMYPRAYVQTLYGYDHLAILLAADDIAASIRKFLSGDERE